MSIVQQPPRLKRQGHEWPKESTWTTPTKENRYSYPTRVKLHSAIQIGATFTCLFVLVFGFPKNRDELFRWELAMLFILFCSFTFFARDARTGKRLLRFTLEGENDTAEQLVTIEIFTGPTPVGRDYGVIGIHDDLLFFSGSGCSFALGRQDFRTISRREGIVKHRADLDAKAFTLQLKHPDTDLSVRVIGRKKGPIRRLVEELREFPASGGPSKSSRSYPPTREPSVPHVSLVRRR